MTILSEPGVSVIVPVHDHAALTRRCIDTLLADRRADCDIVVVDDGSTDATAELLARYDDAIRVVRHRDAQGFASACNDGARAARGDLLVFLNNDTVPQPGWLDELVDHARMHPKAGVVGARLLYPDGTVQHAGLVFGADHMPYHVYARFPGDDPVVLRPRRVQAVTGACMLVTRREFMRARRFDPAYTNGWEDVDLCLRVGALGAEVHYCPTSVVIHYESASRDTRAPEVVRSGVMFRERWAHKVRRDDLDHYAADGLVALHAGDRYPLRLALDPRLARLDETAYRSAVDELLDAQRRRLDDLEREALRLSTALAETLDALAAPLPEPVREPGDDAAAVLLRYQELLAAHTEGRFVASPALRYRALVARIRDAIVAATPPGAVVAVVTRGDHDLLTLDGRAAMHFPAEPEGTWAGHHPGDLAAIIAYLRRACDAGADWFALPATAAWWLEHYDGLAELLDRGDHTATLDDAPCAVWSLAHLRDRATIRSLS